MCISLTFRVFWVYSVSIYIHSTIITLEGIVFTLKNIVSYWIALRVIAVIQNSVLNISVT